MSWIVRVRSASTKGWQARLPYGKVNPKTKSRRFRSRLFSDAVYGGSRKAKQAAERAVRADLGLASRYPFTLFTGGRIPGEEIFVYRQMYEVINRLKVDGAVNSDRIIFDLDPNVSTVYTVIPQTPVAGTVPGSARIVAGPTQGQEVPGAAPPGTDDVTVDVVDPNRLITATYKLGYKPEDLTPVAQMADLPLFLFVVLFGLSMDYHVFILSRIREAYGGGVSTEAAVAHGIRTPAGTVSAAAFVMVAVFSIFVTLSVADMKQFGFGLAAAILIDATIIRAVLLPATMKLLGEWNWYLPRWLRWLPSLERDESVAATEPVHVSGSA